MRCSEINTIKLKCTENKPNRNEINKKNACRRGAAVIKGVCIKKSEMGLRVKQ